MSVAIVAVGATVAVGVAGAYIAANAAENAAETQADATRAASSTQLQAQRESIAAQREALAQQRSDLAPFREAGLQATQQLSAGTQPGGDLTGDVPYTPPAVPQYQPFGLSTFQQDPGYQFRVAEGLKALDRSASARGGLVSGRALKDVQRFGQDQAAQEYQAAYGRHTTDFGNRLASYDRAYAEAGQRFNTGNVNLSNRFNRLASVAGTGQTSAQQIAQATGATGAAIGQQALTTGAAVASNQIQAGNARASGYVGAANAYGAGASNLGAALNSYQQYKLLSSIANRPTGTPEELYRTPQTVTAYDPYN